MPVRTDTVTTHSGTITIHVRAFARFAELLGRDGFALELPAGATVGDAVRRVASAIPGGERLAATALAAVNRRHARLEQVLADGDELAFLPPLAGG